MALGQPLNLSKPEHICENYTNNNVKTFTLSLEQWQGELQPASITSTFSSNLNLLARNLFLIPTKREKKRLLVLRIYVMIYNQTCDRSHILCQEQQPFLHSTKSVQLCEPTVSNVENVCSIFHLLLFSEFSFLSSSDSVFLCRSFLLLVIN